MNRTASIHTRYDAKKGRVVNYNGTSDFWEQIDTDTIISPTNRRYDFYIMGEQNLETGEWKFYFHHATRDGDNGRRVNEINVSTPREAEKWYRSQR